MQAQLKKLILSMHTNIQLIQIFQYSVSMINFNSVGMLTHASKGKKSSKLRVASDHYECKFKALFGSIFFFK